MRATENYVCGAQAPRGRLRVDGRVLGGSGTSHEAYAPPERPAKAPPPPVSQAMDPDDHIGFDVGSKLRNFGRKMRNKLDGSAAAGTVQAQGRACATQPRVAGQAGACFREWRQRPDSCVTKKPLDDFLRTWPRRGSM